jgi:hypothetical protein
MIAFGIMIVIIVVLMGFSGGGVPPVSRGKRKAQ